MTDLPPTLERFGAELEHAVHRDLGGRPRRGRLLRGAVLVAAVAAVALGAFSVLTAGGPSVVERAAAALESSDGPILHYRLQAEQRNPDGSVVSWRSETWQLRVAPYTRRQIEVGSDGIRAESLTKGDLNQLYDARTNTIYAATRQELLAAHMPRIEIVSRSRLAELTGSPNSDAAYLFRRDGSSRPTVVATEQGAERLRKQLAQGRQEPAGALPKEFRDEILSLLNSGHVRETGHVEVGGRDAIRLESLDGRKVYLVDAATYDPIEWTTTGDGGGATLRFPLYEALPVDTESLKLLDLQAQHPGAQVVRGAAGYDAAEQRLYPHG